MDDYDVDYSYCPACGEPIDYCQGHGEIGDYAGWCILQDHDAGEHFGCDPLGCEDAASSVECNCTNPYCQV